jgi:PAS domain S-box-containing protein
MRLMALHENPSEEATLAALRRQERELQRRAEQQTVIADLGHAALRGAPIEGLLVQASHAISTLLETDLCWMLQECEGRYRMVGGAGWPNSIHVDADEVSMSAYALRMNGPVIVTDLATETRFAPPKVLLGKGVVSGICVPISNGRTPAWGVVGAYFFVPRLFSVSEVEFLRAIATVLAQAIERDRVDRQLVRHAAQQSAIAEVSRVALRSVEQAATIACKVIEQVLGVPHAAFVDVDDGSVPNSLSVAVIGVSTRFGVLTAQGTAGHAFSPSDTEFMQSLANILADAMGRERSNQALAASEERYREVVEGASEIIFTVSPDGSCLSLNGAFEQITGWSAAEWIGKNCFDLVDRGDLARVRRSFDEMVLRRRPMAEIMRIAGKHGDVLLDVTAFPKIEAGRTLTIYGFARDVSERRKLEAQLEQANRLASLGRMAATIAHEFNNVLMGISPFVEVIRHGKSLETSLDHIGRAVKRGKRVTEEILRFTRSSQPQVAPFNVDSWIENIILEARSLLPPNCRIETHLQSRDLIIEGDANQLQQVFTNLILNARDAMPAGGTLSIEILRERPHARLPFGVIERPERFAHCIVRDTGLGMSAETLRHIYEPLFTTKKNGTGLGLAVTHQVVTRHGGDIFVESTAGVGTAFHIFLPLSAVDEVVASDEGLPAVQHQRPLTANPRHVLLVEDDASVAAGLVCLLELEGWHVDVVETGAAAIRAIGHIHPDVVVLDVGLPDMEGTDVYDALALKNPQLPVIFSTGHADRARLETYLERPNVGYLLKPYEYELLLRAIEEVLPS